MLSIIGIIIISLLIVVIFVIIAAIVIKLIIDLVQKNKINVNKVIITLSSLVFGIIILIGLNVILIIANWEPISDSILKVSAKIVSKGLILTKDELVKNWDNQFVDQLEKMDVSVAGSISSINKNTKTYNIDLLIENKNSLNEHFSFRRIIEGNYLTICDGKDLVYPLNWRDYSADDIPVGKSKETIKITVAKDINLEYIKYVYKKINLAEQAGK